MHTFYVILLFYVQNMQPINADLITNKLPNLINHNTLNHILNHQTNKQTNNHNQIPNLYINSTDNLNDIKNEEKEIAVELI